MFLKLLDWIQIKGNRVKTTLTLRGKKQIERNKLGKYLLLVNFMLALGKY